MAAGKRLRAALLLSVFLRVLSQLELKCSVSHDGDTTTYNLQEVFCDKDAKKPQFSWFNGSGHVLANHKGQMGLVMSSSFDALTTTRCVESILYEGHVTSQGKPLDYWANCTTTCPPEAETGDNGTPHYWITVLVAIFLLLVGVIGFLCRQRVTLRNHGCFYTPVKNGNQRAENVETGNERAA